MGGLYKSQTNKMISGVIGGIGEYLEVDANLLRVIWTLLVVFTGFVPGIIAYFLAAVILPSRSVPGERDFV